MTSKQKFISTNQNMPLNSNQKQTHINEAKAQVKHRHRKGIYTEKRQQKNHSDEWFFCLETGIDLSSRAVSSQVLLAQVSLTSVFGMGTGGTSPLQTPVMVEY